MNPLPIPKFKFELSKLRFLAYCGSSRKSKRKFLRKIMLIFKELDE